MNMYDEIRRQYEMAAISGLFAAGGTDHAKILSEARAFADGVFANNEELQAKKARFDQMKQARADALRDIATSRK